MSNMNKLFQFSIMSLIIFHFSEMKINRDGFFFVNKILNKINSSKMEKLDFIGRRKYFVNIVSQNEDLRKIALDEAVELGFVNQKKAINDPFPCENYSIPGSGKDVNNLTPQDIKIMAALGDSLTAGLGIDAKTIFGMLWENRGKVFDLGGKNNIQSLINFFKIFNPNIKGQSLKTTFIRSKGTGLNVAVSGGTSEDLMDQLDILLDKLKNDKSIDMDRDWKMFNIFIGNNDICRSCEPENADKFTVKLFKERLFAVLDKIKKEVPKVFVNLITMLELYRVHNLNIGIICTAFHLYECPCVAFPKNLTKAIESTTEFQTAVSEIGNCDRYNDKDDFAVVVQPFFENTYVPTRKGHPDLSYFAPDCFHLSEKGHAQIALSLWNSLFEPISEKNRDWYVGEKFKCPTNDNPFFATRNNYP